MADDNFEAETRSAFEKWISSPPYEMSTKILPEISTWPGQYHDINVERAWRAWLEATRQEVTRREVQHT